MRTMPDRPETWEALLAWLQSVAPSLYALALSTTIAALRVVYGGGSRRQMMLEGALCGAATLAVVPLLGYLGFPADMAVFVGGFVGFVGVEEIRRLAIKLGERRTDA